MRIEIDSDSGFCFGVVTAIRKAEEELAKGQPLYCLGDIVHNSDEVQRLSDKGLKVITHADLASLHGAKVLLRAHGEPPSTYATARDNGIEIIDATCPVVLRLQQRIKQSYSAGADAPQIVIYGKKGHAEVNGLVGQTAGEAIVVESIDELDRLDFSRPIALYSQTTKSLEGFRHIIDEIRSRMAPGVRFEKSAILPVHTMSFSLSPARKAATARCSSASVSPSIPARISSATLPRLISLGSTMPPA